MPALMRYDAKIVHAALYVLLLAVPLTAIEGRVARGPSGDPLVGEITPSFSLAHGLGQTIATVHTC